MRNKKYRCNNKNDYVSSIISDDRAYTDPIKLRFRSYYAFNNGTLFYLFVNVKFCLVLRSPKSENSDRRK